MQCIIASERLLMSFPLVGSGRVMFEGVKIEVRVDVLFQEKQTVHLIVVVSALIGSQCVNCQSSSSDWIGEEY